jgi:formylglycine-generating enzyme required for sulfatase activity/predicted DNA-binding WGR domain protein
MRRFEFVDGKSNKFWEVDVKGKTLNVTFGKIGTKGQSKPKDFATPEKAKAEMEKLIKEKTGKGYVEVGGKAVKPAAKSSAAKSPATKPAAKPPAGKKTDAGSVGEGLSKAEKQAKAEKVLAMFAGGQWELARGILEAAQEEHWLFKELLEGCKIKANIPIPSKKIMDAFGEEKAHKEYDEDGELCYDAGPIKSELVALEVLLHLPKELEELEKLRDELGIKLRANILSKYWNEVPEGQFKGVDLNGGYPGFFADQWYEAREVEIGRVEKECEARSKALNKAWREEEDLGKGVKLEMVLIPAGKFVMGSPKKEKGRYDDEMQHEVTLTKPFYMGKYEVTQEQWEGVTGKNPSYSKNAKNPVTDVSWDDCQEFIKKLNGITKGKYRLPTESEWEYACRAGTSAVYSFGDKITPKDAHYGDSKLGKPIEVGSYKPNAFGLYDMHGNVWEWCEDWKADYPKGAVIDPQGPAKGEDRVLRGGSYTREESIARSRNRHGSAPFIRDRSVGFRLARTAL